MTAFSYLAALLHRGERKLAKWHEKRWEQIHQDERVLVEFKKRDGEWVPRTAHDPEKQTRRDIDGSRFIYMTLGLSIKKYDVGICPHCFYDHKFQPSPY